MRGKKISNKIVFTTLILCSVLIALSYSRWTSMNNISNSITTGTLDYVFGDIANNLILVHDDNITQDILPANISIVDGKFLQIEIMDTNSLLDRMELSDKLIIQYSLMENNVNNVSLKRIDEELGSVELSLISNSVTTTYNGENISSFFATQLLPDSLGTFNVSHSFDGTNGYITLVPTHLYEQNPISLSEDNFPQELMELIGEESNNTDDIIFEDGNNGLDINGKDKIKEVKDEKVLVLDDNIMDMKIVDTLSNDKSEKEIKEINENDSKQLNKIKEKKVKKVKKEINLGTLRITANYSFNIPLNFDQFNSN